MQQLNIRQLAGQLSSGAISCEQMIRERLQLAAGSRGTFVRLNEDIVQQAIAVDQQRRSGAELSPLAGVPLTLKDLFDVQGEKTLAGSKVLENKVDTAQQDAEVVSPLREAGMLFLGRTNMSEFAFSGMGLNPNYPPLYSVWNRETGRLPGGSSSGSAVSVAEGIVPGTLGSDTAGSCRIPAAFNGITGMKPSCGRMSAQGVYPLSHSSDSAGPLAVDVDSCFLLDQLMQGKYSRDLPALTVKDLTTLKLLIPEGVVMSDLDSEVAEAFEAAVQQLENAGAEIIRQAMPVIDDCVDMFFNRNTVIHEAWEWHRELIEAHGDEYDPYVKVRILSGQGVGEAEQAKRYAEKAALIERFNQEKQVLGIDALLYPTVACVPPTVASTQDADNIGAINLRCLRNTSSVNYFDGCAISLPCHQAGSAPVGLMLSSHHGDDDRLLRMAAGIEKVLQS
ncbi:MAG: amidase [Thiolinea sp.]